MFPDPPSPPADTLTLIRPDDWHLHLRDGAMLQAVLPHTARRFARAVVMPNLVPPVASAASALAYRRRILQALPEGADFLPLMTLYLTEATTPAEVMRAHESGAVVAVKHYPAGVTTHAQAGVVDLRQVYPALEAMQRLGMPLLVHGEVNDPAVDIFDRERVFIERELTRLLRDLPALKLVLEHITTREAVDFILQAPAHVAATITAHHLLLSRNAMLAGGIRPHHYCLPVLKREEHRHALVRAATSGGPKFFLGTDSAPHPQQDKQSSCGRAGIYTAHAALELYAEVFDQAQALDRLEGFASLNGPAFYGLPRNPTQIHLTRTPWRVPDAYPAGTEALVPLRAGEWVQWSIAGPSEAR